MTSKEHFLTKNVPKNQLAIVSKSFIRILNGLNVIDEIIFNFENTRQHLLSGDFIYFAKKDAIFKYSFLGSKLQLEDTISFKYLIQTFAVNKNILIVSLQNNETLFFDFDLRISNLVLFDNLSVICFAIYPSNDYIILLSIESGYEIIDLKNFHKKSLFKFEMNEKIPILFKSLINIHENIILILLNDEIVIFDKYFLKIVNKFKVNIEVNSEILIFVDVLMNGQFIVTSTNMGKVFVFNFINNRLFIKYNLNEMNSIACDHENLFYLYKDNTLKTVEISLVSIEEDDTYYDDKILYILGSFVEQRELSASILLENKTRENIRKHFEMFKRNDNKFVIINNSNFK